MAKLRCDTCVCATAAAAARDHKLAGTVRVELPGGVLVVRTGPAHYELAGPAEYVFDGALR